MCFLMRLSRICSLLRGSSTRRLAARAEFEASLQALPVVGGWQVGRALGWVGWGLGGFRV